MKKTTKPSGLGTSGSKETNHSTPRSEAGDTLVELLIAMVVLAIASVAILVAFATSISASSEHRALASFDTALRSAYQDATSQIQYSASAHYVSCATASTYQNQVSFNNLPAGYTAQITSVTYWNAPSSFSFGSSCASGSTSPQLVAISVAPPSGGASSTINAVVSDPAARPIPTAGSASQLVFFEQPGNGVSGSPFRPQPVVAVEDAAGNVVSSDLSDVTLTLNTVSGPAGATLSSTCTGSEFFGIVTFSNCSILKAGTYTVTATDTSLPGFSVTSSPFSVSFGPPSQLVFTTQPNNSTGGVAFPTQPVVTVEDVGGNVVTNDASTVTLAITSGTGTAGAALSGCVGTETNGAVTFAGCAINKAGSGYTLTATDGSLTPATSAAVTVARGPATQLGFTTSPGASTTGNALTPQPVVTVEDAGGNPATTNPSASITLAIGTQPGTGATLACTANPKTATGGVATFAGCKITVATAGSFTLNATAPGLLPAKSAAFTVAGAASKLVFTDVAQQLGRWRDLCHPAHRHSRRLAGQRGDGRHRPPSPWPSPHNQGAVPVSSAIPIPINRPSPAAWPPSPGARSLWGRAHLGLTLSVRPMAACSHLRAAPSPFRARPHTWSSLNSPGGSTGGVAFGTQPIVTVEDAGGNTVTTDTSTVNLAVAAGTGTTGATLSGCSGTETLGVVTFTGCSIDKAGTGLRPACHRWHTDEHHQHAVQHHRGRGHRNWPSAPSPAAGPTAPPGPPSPPSASRTAAATW